MSGSVLQLERHTAVIFDLGNTLVEYFTRAQWPGVLTNAIEQVRLHLCELDLFRIPPEQLDDRVQVQRGEPANHHVRPLEHRLAAIFDLQPDELADGQAMELCRRFMKPVFAAAHRYEETLAVLEKLREANLRTAILSNSPWGSPAELWRKHLVDLRLDDAVDTAVFCRDVGFRKPAPNGFHRVTEQLDVRPQQCLFVGDDPRWDIAGPRAIGMDCVLIDRYGEAHCNDAPVVHSLSELL